MSEFKNVGYTWMAMNTFKCNYLTPLHFKGLSSDSNYQSYSKKLQGFH